MSEQERFEVWADSEPLLRIDDPDNYVRKHARMAAHKGWQAAKADASAECAAEVERLLTFWAKEIEDEQIECTRLFAQNERMRGLLRAARCPDSQCDGKGTTVEMVNVCCGRGVSDGYGDMECCGDPDAEPSPAPCQWCDERDSALAATEGSESVRIRFMEAENAAEVTGPNIFTDPIPTEGSDGWRQKADRLAAAVEALPVEDWVETDGNGDPELIGYIMKAREEWDEARYALTAYRDHDQPTTDAEGE